MLHADRAHQHKPPLNLHYLHFGSARMLFGKGPK